jgi:hypothetical protein
MSRDETSARIGEKLLAVRQTLLLHGAARQLRLSAAYAFVCGVRRGGRCSGSTARGAGAWRRCCARAQPPRSSTARSTTASWVRGRACCTLRLKVAHKGV